ncbi:uncharacterized protein LOC117534321 [Gymnodraco acuticeps]|uniref:Uncharacterized protein LOC117534321 n=1 Tax=Gymnodraco acuticeps TaxID=8218 RepID=A0A6P8SU33_GYMAC|nr:uncharacterized protein LOC117534321 [Gymnodraco acuticeps]
MLAGNVSNTSQIESLMERETVCLTEFAGKGDLVNMSKVQMLLSLKKRLTAAAEDIFALFEKTIAEHEEELSLSKEENERLQKLLDAVLQPQLRIHRADPLLDPLQFAYRANRSVDDAVNMALHFLLQHLDTPGNYARILFVDFNTIIPALLQDKLSQLHVPDSTCRWITDFLSYRKQHVRLGKHVSDPRTISTGSPQGCVLSPLLFSLYTNSCTSSHQSVKLLKFADATTLIGLISGGGGVCLQVGDGPTGDLVWGKPPGAQRPKNSRDGPGLQEDCSPTHPHHSV